MEFLDDPFGRHDPDTRRVMPFVPQWSENQLEIGTLLRYFHTDNMVPVGRVALPPPGQVPVTSKLYQRKVNTYAPDARTITVTGPLKGQPQFVGIVHDASKQYIETRYYNEPAELGSEAQKIYSAVAENAMDFNYIRNREDDRETEVIYYPRGYITFSTIHLDENGIQKAKYMTGYRLCTTQLAMDLYFKLIKAEVFVEPLPAQKRDVNRLPEKSFAIEDDEGNLILEDRRIQDDDASFQVCARVDVDSWVAKKKGFRYRKVTAWHPDDYTVFAYFRKLKASSPWEQIDVEKFDARVKRLTRIQGQAWIFRMEKYNSDGINDLGKGGGTMYLTNGITGESYYVLDPEYVLDGYDLGTEITLRRTFGGDGGLQWKAVTDTHLSRVRGRKIHHDDPSLSLWVQLCNGKFIQDKLVVKRFESVSLQRMERVRATHTIEMQMDLFSRVGLFRGSALRGTSKTKPRDRFTLFLEYCPAGNMRSLIKDFKKRKARLPEPFIWLLFRNLVKDCMHVERVGRVHKKLTLRHILLRNKPVTGNWIAYPSPVVGNFSSLDLIDDIKGSGVKGFLTPEHLKARHEATLNRLYGRPRDQINGSKLHTFAIGICIWSAMRLRETGLPNDQQEYTDPYVLPFQKTSPTDDRSIYSARLESLLKDCLNYRSQRRPSLRDIQQYIDQGITYLKEIKPNVDTRSENELPRVDRIPVRKDNLPLTRDYSAIRDRRNDDTEWTDPSEENISSGDNYSEDDRNDDISYIF